MRVRAWRDHVGAGVDQLAACGDDALPAGRRSRLDDDERVGGHPPQPFKNLRSRVRIKLVQHIGQGDDEIARRAVDVVLRDVRIAPGEDGSSAPAASSSPQARNRRARLDQQRIGEAGPAIGRGPERSARARRRCRARVFGAKSGRQRPQPRSLPAPPHRSAGSRTAR